MTTKTIDFLPLIFQTPANQKFLNATLDQLVTQPDFKRVNGYIGRKFAPTFKVGDNYIQEPTAERQNYQLEPSVVSLDSDGKTQFFSTYTDLLQQIQYYGGFTNNHTRLFGQESYSFDGQFDFDKFVNFSEYYWLPNGTDAVNVFPSPINYYQNFIVDRNVPLNSYTFSGYDNTPNPEIILARGGTYNFNVNQSGFKFWIQSSPGITGINPIQPNIDTRPVLGVANNGTDNGIITFTVPQIDAQDSFITMPIVQAVDYATTLTFNEVENQLLQNLAANSGGIDGVTTNLDGKYIIFISNAVNDTNWAINGLYGLSGYGIDPYNLDPYDLFGPDLNTIPVNNRTGIWQIHIFTTGGNQIIKLSYVQDIPTGEKVFVKSGNNYANFEFYKTVGGLLEPVPLITASLDTLYYNDDTNPDYYGIIRIVDAINYVINVDTEIIGQKNYISPNGITFSNGLKVTFNSGVSPATYANNTYYIEGVGTSIRLINVANFVTPELSAGPVLPDYLTINRSSIDGNAWSRSNRWVHADVIAAAATYNNTIPMFDQLQRAYRPIIEFRADLQLYNNGRIVKPNVNLIDFTITNAFTQIQNAPYPGSFDTSIFKNSETIIFAADTDSIVNTKVYTINVVTEDSITFINLIESPNGDVQIYDVISPTTGANKITGLVTGNSFWYNGTSWVQAQQKVGLNQAPLFDIIDLNFNSFGDISVYNASSFKGCKIFSYLEGKGIVDIALGFPISYRNINNVGGIEFTNNYDTDIFNQLVGVKTVVNNINSGFITSIADRNTLVQTNMWVPLFEKSKQYQIIPYIYNGTTASFQIDILPDLSVLVPNLKVYVNSHELSVNHYSITQVGSVNYVTITSALTINDEVDILIYSSKQISTLGYYEIPNNLNFNALNQKFEVLTHGQFRNHLATIASNTTEILGAVPGDSNLRDLNVKSFGGTILQHSAPVIYSELFLLNNDLNFMNASTYSQLEYSRFKNRILENFTIPVNAGVTDSVAALDMILLQVNAVKNNQSPWYYSDMVPYGPNKNTITYTVLNTGITEYEINSIFNDNLLSNQAVLVYLNGKQLLKGSEYTFDQIRPAINFIVALNYNDIITINVYSNTDGNFIPETPTKLGLYPKFKPEIFIDTSYQTPITVIRGHDGSITPAFGDIRDQILLEFETRIYNNIKITYDITKFDIFNYIPGKFRNTEYNKIEFDTILSRGFMAWISANRTDYTDNLWFSNNNSFSWTYSSFKDVIDESYLPGYWKGIYNYFYDTDAPQLRPWEMLGFSEQPDWWVSTYGPSPYTGGNMVLWGDLEVGRIRHGTNAGIHSQYARPGLSKIIPVDASGNLLPPNEFLVTAFNGANVDSSFVFGDEGPVETAWRQSSDYPFAIQQALATMKPAMYFSQFANINDYSNINGMKQWLFGDTNQRINISTFEVNGEITTAKNINAPHSIGTIKRQAGYLNWISDYVAGYGANGPAQIHKYLDKLQVNLGYRVAGFTDQEYISVFADQVSPTDTGTNKSIVIPNENYQVYVHKSSPVKKLIYSGVIIEKTTAGFSVTGYSSEQPYFTIIPSNPNNNSYNISAAGVTGIIYNNYQTITTTIPYGHEFVNKQQIVDFLISYGRYLTSQGFTFTDIDPNLQVVKDWILSVKEFLTWTQQGWATGNIIVVSPVSNSISLNTTDGVVDAVTNLPSGSKIMDVGFNIIKSNNFTVMRDNGIFKLTTTASNISIGLLDISIVQYENALIFDNETVFNDIIYLPALGNRQYRLKLIGSITENWNGEFNPPGFIYNNPHVPNWQQGQDYRQGDIIIHGNSLYTALQDIDASNTFNFSLWSQVDRKSFKTGMLPNLSYNASKFLDMYDVDNQINDQGINEYAMGLIGFRDRDYLTQLRVDTTSQVKFYQGFIREKGTPSAVTALANATFDNLSGNLSFYEEWALRVGSYGATESNQFLEVQLSDNIYTYNPISFALFNNGETINDTGVINVHEADLYKKPLNYTPNIIENRSDESIYSGDITSAGYVNVNDIDGQIFDITDITALNQLIPSIHVGYKLWVAKDNKQDWNVYRISKSDVTVANILYQLNSFALITTNTNHNLSVNDIFVVQGFSSNVDGFYTVIRVDNSNTIFVAITSELNSIMKITPELTGTGELFNLNSMRIKYQTDTLDITPTFGWINGDVVWVDDNNTNPNWAVYQKGQPWKYVAELTANSFQSTANSKTGSSAVSSLDGLIALSGAPNLKDGSVKTFIRINDNYIPSSSILPVYSPFRANINFQSNIATYPFTANLTFTPDPAKIITATYGIGPGDVGLGIPISPELYTIDFANSKIIFSDVGNPLSSNITISQIEPEKFGSSIDIQQNTIAVGGPNFQSNIGTNSGRVSIYNISASGQTALTQIIDPDLFNAVHISTPGYQTISNTYYFGSSISLSSDAQWLYVGAPAFNSNIGSVYAFGLKNIAPSSQTLFTLGNITVPGSKGPYTLSVTDPTKTLGIVVSNLYYTFIPNVDYTISGNTITFTANTIGLTYEITQNPYYDFCAVLSPTAGNIGDSFGSAIKTQSDGTYLVAGAPGDSGNIGQAYAFNRSIQEFVANGVQTSFTLYDTPNQNIATYYLDGVEFYPNITPNVSLIGNTIEFVVNTQPLINTVFRAELNHFIQVQEFNSNNALGLANTAAFGSSVTLSNINDEVFVGAPGPNTSLYQDGQVYRFTNDSVSYNTALVYSDVSATSANIIINNKVISANIANIASANIAVNTEGIIGLTSTNENGNLRLSYTSSISGDNLSVLITTGNTSLHSPYILTQTIQHPQSYQYQYKYFNSQFGSTMAYEEKSGTLIISGVQAPLIEPSQFDEFTTTFDSNTTAFFDVIGVTGSEPGSVYVFEELGNPLNSISLPSQFIFTEILQPSDNTLGTSFGSSIAVSYNSIFVGADQANVQVSGNTLIDAGRFYYYSNPNKIESWQLIRQETPQVDLDNVTRIYLYDSSSQTMLSSLDFIDPAKGKILGIADQDITYKSAFDPAQYNTGTNVAVSINPGYCWGKQQVGQVWWNLSQVRYIDYEQDNLTYRIKNWGALFPGSVIEINEWIESSVLPSQYVGDGKVRYPDDSAYVQKTMVSPSTGFIISTYYYWVTNRTVLDSTLTWRTSTSASITNLIKSPNTQNIPYATFIKDNTISLINSNQFLNSDRTILHIDYSVVPNNNIIHNEWELIQENSPTAILPKSIINKMIDSITGSDQSGNPVPDPKLGIAERYGITIRPRQTMFVSPTAAAKNLVEFANTVFLSTPIVVEFNLANLYLSDPVPTSWDLIVNKNVSVNTTIDLTYLDPSSLTTGQIILVLHDTTNNGWAEYQVQSNKSFVAIRTQTYQTSDYWTKVDWFDSTYDSTIKPTYTVANIADMSTLTLVNGDIVWVTNNGAGLFIVYRVNSDLSISMVGLQQGTIQLSDALWNHEAYEIGFDNDRFDTVKFDLNPTTEFRNIINALYNDIFINSLQGQFNKMFFILLNYILSEQRLVDWAFKTSFVSVVQQLRKLEQFPNYIEDNQTYYEDYINEVKPYRTTIREYVIDYEGNDIASIHPTDFDLPAYYDTDFNMWRSPSGEHAKDALLLSTEPQYADWYANHAYFIDSVEITIPGYGYTTPPQLTVQGGGGIGAVLEAQIDIITGSVIDVIVVKPGAGYTWQPIIVVQGNGVDDDGNQTCHLYPVLSNKLIRSFDTTIKFDRISYTSIVKQWEANTIFNGGDIVSYNNLAYTVNGNIAINSNLIFETSSYTLLPGDQLTTAADRVMAFYAPTEGMPPKTLSSLFYGTEYPGNLLDGSDFNHYTDIHNVEYTVDAAGNYFLLDSNIQSSFTDLLLGTRPEDINIDGGQFVDTYNSHAPEELIPGIIYDTLDLKVFTIDSTNPTDAPLGYRMTKTMLKESITVFDVIIDPNWEQDEINIDTVTTTFDSGNTTFDFTATKNAWEFRRICANATTTLSKDLSIGDTNIYVEDASILYVPNPALGIPGVIYINSEKIIYWQLDVGTPVTFDANTTVFDSNTTSFFGTKNGTISHFRRGTWGTGSPLGVNVIVKPWIAHSIYNGGDAVIYANVAYIVNGNVSYDAGPTFNSVDYTLWSNSVVLPAGALVVDASVDQLIPGNTLQSSWLDLSVLPGRILSGNGLRASVTPQALFLKNCPSYLPWLPGESGIPIDPNLYHTRFDDDGLGQPGYPFPIDHPPHPFDVDNFDSWTVG